MADLLWAGAARAKTRNGERLEKQAAKASVGAVKPVVFGAWGEASAGACGFLYNFAELWLKALSERP